MKRQNLSLDPWLAEDAIEDLDLPRFAPFALRGPVKPYLADIVRPAKGSEEALDFASGQTSNTKWMQAQRGSEELLVFADHRQLPVERARSLSDSNHDNAPFPRFRQDPPRVSILIEMAVGIHE